MPFAFFNLGPMELILLGGCGLFSAVAVAAVVVVIVLAVTKKGKRPDEPG